MRRRSGSAFAPSSTDVRRSPTRALRRSALRRTPRADARGREDLLQPCSWAGRGAPASGRSSLGGCSRVRPAHRLRRVVRRGRESSASADTARLDRASASLERQRRAVGLVDRAPADRSRARRPCPRPSAGRSGRCRPNGRGTRAWCAYMNGRPTTCLRPTIFISLRSISVPSTPDVLTPRISAISAAVTGCL